MSLSVVFQKGKQSQASKAACLGDLRLTLDFPSSRRSAMISRSIVAVAASLLLRGTSCVGFEQQRGFAAAAQQQQHQPSVALLAAPNSAGEFSSAPSTRTPRTTCRSNSTHIFWADEEGESGENGRAYQTFSDAIEDCVHYLRRNIMPFDVPNLLTLGYPPDDSTQEQPGIDLLQRNRDGMPARRTQQVRRARHGRTPVDSDNSQQLQLPDGLSDGIVNRTVHLALQTKMDHAWADHVPRQIFYEYILSFACTNEARTNWRPLFTDVVKRIIADADVGVDKVEDVVELISKELFIALSPNPEKPIHFVAGQTPLIFDPMSVIAYGYASCTGMSIVLVFALRAAGIPARLVGTPAWNGDVEKGNHNWVEVYTRDDDAGEGQWRILEGGGDALQKDPCERWFCNAGRFDGTTRVFAARLDRALSDGVSFPLAWDTANQDVPAEERTDWYTEICSKC